MKSFFKRSGPEAGAETPVRQNGVNTVLIIDDSPTEQHVMKQVLRKAGYIVETADNGEVGVEAARRLQPDVILMDVVMPVLNGFQATRQLSNDEATAGIPVIMITTKDQETDKRWGMRQGAKDYLVKPVDAALLIEKIEAVLGG